ncbi:uncharacterized protein MICPUCDRAFT_64311 [Micromonas pusilla CCMP1545]|uniref:Predicted protein n=1 Tax=Micromonas pusilla (strain CCMP1545) TaxID=564608 RepID=C1MKC5_MICPC|nr:uncharacterized protein MICPUCDRAFT_64311 [Micromonas pusilla CCMP1545]EEH59739.1 predicted protein [Micromonas pusilla CCMP1545]|eukprot:XP_003056363.1 predicted protein [Micromonas pusilla CCMP1545]
MTTIKRKIEEKRTVLPVLIMRQMSGRLADLRQFQGISKIGILTQGVSTNTSLEIVDFLDFQQISLLNRCRQLPEIRARLENATKKLSSFLTQIDSQGLFEITAKQQ